MSRQYYNCGLILGKTDTHVVRLAPLSTSLSRRLATIVSHKRSSVINTISDPATSVQNSVMTVNLFYCG